jgi:hypothetical protein
MRFSQTRILVIVMALGGLASSVALAENEKGRPTPEFMRQKLNYSQGILEGLVLEKYDLIATNAASLRNMNVTNAFLSMGNPAYRSYITSFQTNVDSLVRAAENKNLADATEAYAKVVKNCVQCHQDFRREQFIRRQK